VTSVLDIAKLLFNRYCANWLLMNYASYSIADCVAVQTVCVVFKLHDFVQLPVTSPKSPENVQLVTNLDSVRMGLTI